MYVCTYIYNTYLNIYMYMYTYIYIYIYISFASGYSKQMIDLQMGKGKVK